MMTGETTGVRFSHETAPQKTTIIRNACFTRVGQFNIGSDICPTTGLTLSAQPAGFPGAHGGPGFGFHGYLKLMGDCPSTHPITGEPMRYRFGARPAGSSEPIRWLSGPAAVAAVKVGTRPVLWNFGEGVDIYPQDILVAGCHGYRGAGPAPLPSAPSRVSSDVSWGPMPPLVLEPDAQGWICVPPDVTNQGFSGPLLRIDSCALSPASGVAPCEPGEPVESPESGDDFELFFEAAPLPGCAGGVFKNRLPRLHLNNSPEVAVVSAQPRSLPGICAYSPALTALDLRFTVDHELLDSWELGLATSAPMPGGLPDLSEGQSGRGVVGAHTIDTTAWPDCAYALTFSLKLKLTDGEQVALGRTGIAAMFCKRD